jgi:hypothetical protein
MTSTATASGMLTRKASRHEKWSMSQPPSTGPMAAGIALYPDQVPIALPRRSFGNDAPRIARLPGTRSAPPTPLVLHLRG